MLWSLTLPVVECGYRSGRGIGEIAEAVGFDPVAFLADFLSGGPTDDSSAQ